MIRNTNLAIRITAAALAGALILGTSPAFADPADAAAGIEQVAPPVLLLPQIGASSAAEATVATEAEVPANNAEPEQTPMPARAGGSGCMHGKNLSS